MEAGLNSSTNDLAEYTFIWNSEAWGITQKSLKNLRNELSLRIKNETCVVQVETNPLVCGYFIVDKTKREVAFTGDGFRMDRGGEGGAGFKTVEKLFRIFSLGPDMELDCSEAIKTVMNSSYGREVSDEGLHELTKATIKAEFLKIFDELEFFVLHDKNPEYIR